MKYYAVRHGRTPGIYRDWASCEKQIKGFSNASYKSFKTLEEAENFLYAFQKKPDSNDEKTIDFFPCAYIDGSYDSNSERYSYGVVILLNEHDQGLCFSKCFEKDGFSSMRNVSGEIKASEFAIQYALEHHFSRLDLYYDYLGIEKWATGEWKRNLDATAKYHEFCQDAMRKIHIEFHKVKSHSGVKYNEIADSLAKKALELI